MAKNTARTLNKHSTCRKLIGDVFTHLDSQGVNISQFWPEYAPPDKSKSPDPDCERVLHDLASHPKSHALGKRISNYFDRAALWNTMESMQTFFLQKDVQPSQIAREFHILPSAVAHWFDEKNPSDPGDKLDSLKFFAKYYGWVEPTDESRIVCGCSAAISRLYTDVLANVATGNAVCKLSHPDFTLLHVTEQRHAHLKPEQVTDTLMKDLQAAAICLYPSTSFKKRQSCQHLNQLLKTWLLWFRLTVLLLPPYLDPTAFFPGKRTSDHG